MVSGDSCPAGIRPRVPDGWGANRARSGPWRRPCLDRAAALRRSSRRGGPGLLHLSRGPPPERRRPTSGRHDREADRACRKPHGQERAADHHGCHARVLHQGGIGDDNGSRRLSRRSSCARSRCSCAERRIGRAWQHRRNTCREEPNVHDRVDAPRTRRRSRSSRATCSWRCLATMELANVELGIRLGLYEALAGAGPVTPAELADRAGIAERYAREWLEQQAVAGVVEVDDTTEACRTSGGSAAERARARAARRRQRSVHEAVRGGRAVGRQGDRHHGGGVPTRHRARRSGCSICTTSRPRSRGRCSSTT